MNKTVYPFMLLFGAFFVSCSDVQIVVDEQPDSKQARMEAVLTASNAEGEGDALYFVVFIEPAYKLVQVMELPFSLAIKKKDLHDQLLSYESNQFEKADQLIAFNNDQRKEKLLEDLREKMLAIRGRVISLNSEQVPADIKEGMLLDRIKSEGEASELECKYVAFK